MFALPLVAGVLLDKLLGDPLWLPHPVVGFGKLIAFFEHRLNHGAGRKFKGACVAAGLVTLTWLSATLLLQYAWQISPVLYVFLAATGVFYCLAGKTLIDEVRMVFEAADCSLEELSLIHI